MNVPFTDVSPIPLLLGFVEVYVKVNDELLNEALPQKTGLQLGTNPSPLELKVLFLSDVSSNRS